MSCGVDVRTAQSRISAVDGILNRFANVSKLRTLSSSCALEQSKMFCATHFLPSFPIHQKSLCEEDAYPVKCLILFFCRHALPLPPRSASPSNSLFVEAIEHNKYWLTWLLLGCQRMPFRIHILPNNTKQTSVRNRFV